MDMSMDISMGISNDISMEYPNYQMVRDVTRYGGGGRININPCTTLPGNRTQTSDLCLSQDAGKKGSLLIS